MCGNTKVIVDDVEADKEGIVDVVLDDNAIRQVPRPGTSLRTAATPSGEGAGTSQAYRPTTQSGKTIIPNVRCVSITSTHSSYTLLYNKIELLC